MPALASEVFGLAHLAGNYSLLSVRSCCFDVSFAATLQKQRSNFCLKWRQGSLRW